MKYIYIYFIVGVVASAYITAAEDVLLSSTNKVCDCKDLLNQIVKQIADEYTNLEKLCEELDDLEEQLKELVGKVDNQGDQLSDIEKHLAIVDVLQQAVLKALNDQSSIFECITDNLTNLDNNVDEVLCNANEQSSIVETLSTCAWDIYECNNDGFCKLN